MCEKYFLIYSLHFKYIVFIIINKKFIHIFTINDSTVNKNNNNFNKK